MSRKRLPVLIALLCVLCVVGIPRAVAQDSAENEAGTKFRLVPHVGVSGAIGSVHLVPGAAFRFQPGVLGIGTDVKLYQGLYPLETYLAGHALLHIGAFYIGGGGSFPLWYKDADGDGKADENHDNDDTYYFYTDQLVPSFALGTMFPFKQDTKQSLGMRVGLEWTLTGFPFRVEQEPENIGEAIGIGLAAGIAGGLGWVFNGIKLNIGLTYSYGF